MHVPQAGNQELPGAVDARWFALTLKEQRVGDGDNAIPVDDDGHIALNRRGAGIDDRDVRDDNWRGRGALRQCGGKINEQRDANQRR